MRTKSYQFTGVALNRPGSWVSTSCNKASASARTWRRQFLIARGSPCASTNGDLSRSDISMRAAAFAAQRSKALACCRHASRTTRLTSARSTDRRAFRLPTVTPKRTLAAPSPITPAAVQAALIDNICRVARIDCSRAARRTAEYWAGVLSRRAEAKPLWLSRAATLNSTAALHALPLNAHLDRRCLKPPGVAGLWRGAQRSLRDLRATSCAPKNHACERA